MKTPSLAFVVLAITAFVPVATQARPVSEAYRHAQSMQTLSNDMVHEFRKQLGGHRRTSSEEARFLQSLRTLESQCDQLLDNVKDREDRHCLERTFSSIERTFHSARDKAARMPICACLKGLMSKFDRSLHAFEDTGLRGHDHRHGDREVSSRFQPTPPRPGSLLQGLFQKLQSR